MNSVGVNPAVVLLELLGLGGGKGAKARTAAGKAANAQLPAQFVMELLSAKGRAGGEGSGVTDDSSKTETVADGHRGTDKAAVHVGVEGAELMPAAPPVNAVAVPQPAGDEGNDGAVEITTGVQPATRLQHTPGEEAVAKPHDAPGLQRTAEKQPEVPAAPATRAQSAVPATPATRAQPAVPAEPGEHGQPATPAEPAVPAQRAVPAQPAVAGRTRTSGRREPGQEPDTGAPAPATPAGSRARVVHHVPRNEGTTTSGNEGEDAPTGGDAVPSAGQGVQAGARPESAAPQPARTAVAVSSVEELFQRLVEYSRVHNDDGVTTWQLRISEPDVGRIEVHLDWRQDTLHAVFRGRPQLASEFEQQVLVPLRAMLQQEGIDLGTFAWEGGQTGGQKPGQEGEHRRATTAIRRTDNLDNRTRRLEKDRLDILV